MLVIDKWGFFHYDNYDHKPLLYLLSGKHFPQWQECRCDPCCCPHKPAQWSSSWWSWSWRWWLWWRWSCELPTWRLTGIGACMPVKTNLDRVFYSNHLICSHLTPPNKTNWNVPLCKISPQKIGREKWNLGWTLDIFFTTVLVSGSKIWKVEKLTTNYEILIYWC